MHLEATETSFPLWDSSAVIFCPCVLFRSACFLFFFPSQQQLPGIKGSALARKQSSVFLSTDMAACRAVMQLNTRDCGQ